MNVSSSIGVWCARQVSQLAHNCKQNIRGSSNVQKLKFGKALYRETDIKLNWYHHARWRGEGIIFCCHFGLKRQHWRYVYHWRPAERVGKSGPGRGKGEYISETSKEWCPETETDADDFGCVKQQTRGVWEMMLESIGYSTLLSHSCTTFPAKASHKYTETAGYWRKILCHGCNGEDS